MTTNWTQLVLGLWIIVSPWLLGFSSITVMKWSNLIAGTIIFLINVWIIFGERKSSNRGDGAK
ncbi:MAG: SPW repeat protein [Candidatus Liptonbacteria bacterium]|nr:SPW repeat protein [Candidatus Liptonbacteria bacterium]